MRKFPSLLFCLTVLLPLQIHSQADIIGSTGTPEMVETRGPKNGTLLIIGGSASKIFYEIFMELVGGPDAPIIAIPTAMTSDELTADDLDEFIEPIENATGIWFSGGRQWRHADSYLGTRSHEAFFDLLNRGGVIAGSSAGATIQGSYLARGDTKANTIMMGDQFSVLGESYVAIYDGSRWSAERDTVYQLPKESRDFYLLKTGDRYDMRERKVILH